MSSTPVTTQASSNGSGSLAKGLPSKNTAFDYQALAKNGIRLLKIVEVKEASNDLDSQIRCTLAHFETESTPPYYALSYLWGDSKKRKPITLNDIHFEVTENLYDALFHLQEYEAKLTNIVREALNCDLDTGLYLWVDAVCINQNDASEKSLLVPQMGLIFGNAFNVLVWLNVMGTSSGELTSVRSSLEEASTQLEAHKENETAILRIPLLLVAGVLARCSWFRRVWVIQEYALARRTPLVHFMQSMVPLEDLRLMLLRLRAAETGTGDLPLAGQAYQRTLDELLNLMSTISERFRPAAFQQLSLPERLEYVILRKGIRSCTISHDHIYAILGLIGATSLPPYLAPNYAVHFREIAEPYSRYIFSHTGSLALLDNRFLERDSTTPSWVSDFQPNNAAVVEGRLNHFYETILAEKAKNLQMPLADLWRSALATFADIVGAKLDFDTVSEFISVLNDAPDSSKSYPKMIAEYFFSMYGYALLDCGDILYYWPPEREFGNGEHISGMFPGAVSSTILEKLENEAWQCVVQAQHFDNLSLRPRPYNPTKEWFESKELQRFTLV